MSVRERDERNEQWGLADVEDAYTDGEPGPWFTAGFDTPCSRGFCGGITEGDTIRADGVKENSWECQPCVELESEAAASPLETKPEWA
jgi:hypothetical protein